MKKIIPIMLLTALMTISVPSATKSDSIAIADDAPSVQTAEVAKPIIVTPVPKNVKQAYVPYFVMVSDAFADAPVMVKIAQAESQFNPTNKNPNSSARGLFQIIGSTWKMYGCTGDVMNAQDNIDCARKIYEDGGTIAWNPSKSVWSKL